MFFFWWYSVIIFIWKVHQTRLYNTFIQNKMHCMLLMYNQKNTKCRKKSHTAKAKHERQKRNAHFIFRRLKHVEQRTTWDARVYMLLSRLSPFFQIHSLLPPLSMSNECVKLKAMTEKKKHTSTVYEYSGYHLAHK